MVTVEKYDSLYSIAKHNGSNEAAGRGLNPNVDFQKLKPCMTVRVQKTDVQTVITGWDPVTVDEIARRYNANGRGTYAAELTYAYDLIKRDKWLHAPYY